MKGRDVLRIMKDRLARADAAGKATGSRRGNTDGNSL
jgi:hypothetical protein